MRDIKALHPDLQEKVALLQKKCAAAGITIGIGECLICKGQDKAGKDCHKCQRIQLQFHAPVGCSL